MEAAYNFDHNNAAASGLADLVSKRVAPNSDWTAMNGTDHFVQFYEADDYIVNSVAEYVLHGIKTNETCIIAATPEHIAEIERIVDDFGTDIEAARFSGLYVALDAHETLAKFMVGDMPDEKLFDEVIGTLVRNAAKRGRLRIFGEMVAVLLAEGNPAAALRLEELWNNLRKKQPFSLFCAYSIGGMSHGGKDNFMADVCHEHSRVIPDESYTSLNSADERLRSIAFLQQRGRQLEAELAELESRISSRQGLIRDFA